VLWLAPEQAEPAQIADAGQAAPVAPFAPEIVGDTTPAVPDSPAGLTDAPERTSGDGTMVSEPAIDVDPAYLDDTDGRPPSADQGTLPEAGLRADEGPGTSGRPAWVLAEATAGSPADEAAPADPVATDRDIDAGPVPSATDADAHHVPDDEAVPHQADLLDAAPSAGVSADAPVVAPEVPEVEVPALGTGPEEVPADAAYEDEPPALERTPGAPEAVVDEPRFSSDVAERPVPVGGIPDALGAATPSATRSPLDEPESDDESSTHQ
jgi:hypothetical protein